MLRFINTVITSAIATLLASLLILALQDKIAPKFDGGRIIGNITFSPWAQVGSADEKELIKDGVNPADARRFITEPNIYMLEVEIVNPGKDVVSHINIYLPRLLLSYVKSSRGDLICPPGGEQGVVLVRDLSPGDKVTFYVWTPYEMGNKYYFNDIKTFSSKGDWVLKINLPERLVSSGSFGDLIDKYAPWVFFAGLFVFGLFSLLAYAVVLEYVKKLMKDEGKYLDEKIRYEENPKQFKPKLDA